MIYSNDVDGQIVRRDEQSASSAAGNPHEVWYRFAGVQIGMTGNNWNFDLNYNTSVQYRTQIDHGGPYRYGFGSVGASDNFEQSADRINSFNQGSVAGAYTVRGGDTLAGIAAGLWGDSALWYKLAEANGLSASSALTEGQQLRLPAGVRRSSFNASTFTPYNPADAIGDTQPTTPQPQKAGHHKKCGVLGTILIAVVAVAVTVVTAGAAVAALAPASAEIATLSAGIGAVLSGSVAGAVGIGGAIAIGAGAAAVGSVVSQGLAVATGIQEKFSWKGVALSALSGAVGIAGGGSGTFGQRLLSGAINNATVQGVSVATGLQKSFNWAGVAAAGIGSAAGGAASDAIGGSLGRFGGELAAGAAGAIANAATRSAIQGTSFGDNILAAIPDVIAQALGNAAARGIGRSFANRTGAAPPLSSGAHAAEAIAAQATANPVALPIPTIGDEAAAAINAEFFALFGPSQVISPQDAALFNAANHGRVTVGDGVASAAQGVTRGLWTEPRDRTIGGLNLSVIGAPKLSDLLLDMHAGGEGQLREVAAGYGGLDADSGPLGLAATLLYELPDSLSDLAEGYHNFSKLRELVGILGDVAADDRYGAFINDDIAVLQAELDRRAPIGIYEHGIGSDQITDFIATGGAASIGKTVVSRAAVYAAERAGARAAAERTGVDLSLTYKPGWSAAQRAEADLKVQILTEGDTVVSSASRSGTSAASRYRRAGNDIPVGNDVDHAIDLQLGGSDTVSNMWPLNSSVNRSLGSQIQQRIKNLPPGTVVNKVTIRDR